MSADMKQSPSRGRAYSNDDKPRLSLSGDTARKPSAEQTIKPMQEVSPLLSASGSTNTCDDEELTADGTQLDRWDEFEETKSPWYMILLTISIGGLQLAWTVEFSNGTPYLLSLGLSKSAMALVWIAGPLSGSLVQPYIGIMSDNCRSRWGKRRPFMAVGAIATITALAGLAWVREIVGGFFGLFGADQDSAGVKYCVLVVAVLCVYMLDFSINTVQAAIRAFILDCCSSHQQETANAMASRVIGVGNIMGYIAGYVNLRKHLWFFGNTQFKVLCVIASCALASTVLLSSSTIKERDPRLEGSPPKNQGGFIAFLKQIFSSIKRLPPQTRKVCEVEFFAWIGFFPQLFYSSSYVGNIYVQSFLHDSPNMSPEEIDHLYEKATRIGTFALLMYAITSLTTNVFLPFLIAPSYDTPAAKQSLLNSSNSYSTRFSRILNGLVVPWLTLRRTWMLAHILFACCMFSTLWVRSVNGATVIIALVGISWALTLWAPYAIISAEVSKRDALRRIRSMNSEVEDEVDQAGVILGIHNISIAAPQILATLGSSLAFTFFQKPRGTPGDHSFSIVLAAGGVFALVAAWITSTIHDELPPAVEGSVENGGRHSRAHSMRRDIVQGRRSIEAPLMRSGSFAGAGGGGL